MRRATLAALLFAAAAGTGCAARSQPYRFSMPMLGQADVPPESLGAAHEALPARPASPAQPRNVAQTAAPHAVYAYGWQKDAQSGIRTISADGIELRQPEASDATALAVAESGLAHAIETQGITASHLRAPNRDPAAASAFDAAIAATSGPPHERLHEPADLRALVGVRDKRDPSLVVLGWAADLGITFVDAGTALETARSMVAAPIDGPTLVAWADAHAALLAPTESARPGDLLVFDRAVANKTSDLIGIVTGRDTRGVTEFTYAGGGVIRRGFVDPTRPSTRRDLTGAVVNTFLRNGDRWPPKGTRYLAGELLAHVIHIH
jgi:hypothetical protein